MSPTDATLAEELCRLHFTSGLPEAVVNELAGISRFVEFQSAETIFQQGTENHDLYVLRSGRVGLDMFIPTRGTVRILTLSRGELLAWSALIGDGHMTSSATALEPVRAIAIDGARLKILCEIRPDIGYQVMRQLAWALSLRLVATRLQLLDLYSHSTPHLLRAPDGGS